MKRLRSYVFDERFRERLIKMWKEKVPTKDIGERLGVSKNTIVGRARRLVLEGVIVARENPVPLKRMPDGKFIPVVSRETEEAEEALKLAAEIKADIEKQIEAASTPRPVGDKDPLIPPLPPVTRHSRASLRRMDEMAAVDLPLASLRPDGTLFFFFGPSRIEPFVPLPELRKGCPWIISEPGAGDKRRWQGASFCGNRVGDGMTYCPQHQSIASTQPIRRGLVVF